MLKCTLILSVERNKYFYSPRRISKSFNNLDIGAVMIYTKNGYCSCQSSGVEENFTALENTKVQNLKTNITRLLCRCLESKARTWQ